jgi:tetratricopeptide (TPR) repeat protein
MYMHRTTVFFLATAIATSAGSIARAADDPADCAFQQGRQSLQAGDYNRAATLLQQAAHLAPKQAKYRGYLGLAHMHQGNFQQGAADFLAAIELNPDDAGQKYPPPPLIAKLAQKDLDRAAQQVDTMLRDRPAMTDYKPNSDFLRRWAIRKFAGEDLGSPIDWDPSAPLHSDAEHLAPQDGDNAAILVQADDDAGPQRGNPRDFEELWAGAIYELHNVNNAQHFIRLNREAEEGKISKTAFVDGILRYELQAAQQTRAFYVHVYLPWTEKHRIPTRPTLWFCDWWDTPDTVLQSFTDKSSYPWRPYARTHDWTTVQRGLRQGLFPKALRLLKQMRNEQGYEDEQPKVDYWIKQCREKLDVKKPRDTESAEKNKK